MRNFIIYARKSTESEDRQAKSIEDQIATMKEMARRENINILEVLQESKSAKKPGRPIFNSMIEKIKKGKADGILCWKLDRLSRNPIDAGMVQWLLQSNLLQEVKTHERTYLPSDNVLLSSIGFSMANQFLRDLSCNVKRGLTEKVRRGEYPGMPPVGYVRDLKTKLLVLDENNWQYISKMFTLYATGLYSVQSLAKAMFDEGLRSRNGKKVYASGIHKMLKNDMYYGWFVWKGQLQKGIHPSIISKDVFDQVQYVLDPRKHLKRENKREYTYRGFMICGECGLKITAETQKGHNYYHCTKSRGASRCSQGYVREEEVIKNIFKHLDKLRFDDDTLDVVIGATKELSRAELGYQQEIERKNVFLLERNKTLQSSLIEKFIDNAIPKDMYERKLTELRNEEAVLDNNISNAKENHRDVFAEIELIAKFLKKASFIFKSKDDEIRKEIISVISSNIIIKDKKVASITLKPPFSLLMKDIENKKSKSENLPIFEPLILALDKRKTDALASAHPYLSGRRDSNPV